MTGRVQRAAEANAAAKDLEQVNANTLRDAIKRSEQQFANALPAHVDTARFIRSALTALGTVPKLAECTWTSVLAGLMQAAQLGLEVSDVRGQAFLIPRKDGKTGEMRATFQLGYRGMIDLAARSGITVAVDEICANDTYDYQQGTQPRLYHKPTLAARGDTIAYYAVAHFGDGRLPQFVIIGRGEAEEHRDRFASSRDYNSKEVTGPWVTDFDAMARKTAVRQLLNYLPVSVELRQAAAIDTTGTDEPLNISYLPPVNLALTSNPADTLDAASNETAATDTAATDEGDNNKEPA